MARKHIVLDIEVDGGSMHRVRHPCKVNRVMEADTTLGVGGSRICVYAVFEVIRRI